MTTSTDVPALQDHELIAAPPAVVWALVGDPTRMAEWSPQVDSTRRRRRGLRRRHPVHQPQRPR